jgi:hypothetical protein
VKLLIPLIANTARACIVLPLALFAGCETTTHYAKPTGTPPPYFLAGAGRTLQQSSEPSAADQYFAEQAAQQARDNAQLAQQQHDDDLVQRFQQAAYNAEIVYGRDR